MAASQLGQPGFGGELVQPVEQDVQRASPDDSNPRKGTALRRTSVMVTAVLQRRRAASRSPSASRSWASQVRASARHGGWLMRTVAAAAAEVVHGRAPVTGQIGSRPRSQLDLADQAQLARGPGSGRPSVPPVLGQRGEEGALDDDHRAEVRRAGWAPRRGPAAAARRSSPTRPRATAGRHGSASRTPRSGRPCGRTCPLGGRSSAGSSPRQAGQVGELEHRAGRGGPRTPDATAGRRSMISSASAEPSSGTRPHDPGGRTRWPGGSWLETAYAGRCHALLSRTALTRLVSASERCPSQAWLTPSSPSRCGSSARGVRDPAAASTSDWASRHGLGQRLEAEPGPHQADAGQLRRVRTRPSAPSGSPRRRSIQCMAASTSLLNQRSMATKNQVPGWASTTCG